MCLRRRGAFAPSCLVLRPGRASLPRRSRLSHCERALLWSLLSLAGGADDRCRHHDQLPDDRRELHLQRQVAFDNVGTQPARCSWWCQSDHTLSYHATEALSCRPGTPRSSRAGREAIRFRPREAFGVVVVLNLILAQLMKVRFALSPSTSLTSCPLHASKCSWARSLPHDAPVRGSIRYERPRQQVHRDRSPSPGLDEALVKRADARGTRHLCFPMRLD